VFSLFSSSITGMIPSSYAHWDAPPNGEPYHTKVVLHRIDYNDDDWEDYFSGADLVIGWRVDLTGHEIGTTYDTIARDDLSLDSGTYLPVQVVMFEHDECEPLGDLRMSFWSAESDQENTLDTNRIMEQLIQNLDLSTAPITGQQQIEDAGDQWIGFNTHVSDASLADGGIYLDAEYSIPLDAAESLVARVTVERKPTTDNGQCDSEPESQKAIPDWFKSNAKWWKEGLISDDEIINAIESLMRQGVIKIKQTDTKPQQTTQQKAIPSYVKDVFGFWSDDAVSDSEVSNSIGFLISQGIISSPKLQEKLNEQTFGPDKQSKGLTKDEIKKIFSANKLLEMASKMLRDDKNKEYDNVDEQLEDAWKLYAETETQIDLDDAKKLEQRRQDIKEDVRMILDIEKTVEKNISTIKDKYADWVFTYEDELKVRERMFKNKDPKDITNRASEYYTSLLIDFPENFGAQSLPKTVQKLMTEEAFSHMSPEQIQAMIPGINKKADELGIGSGMDAFGKWVLMMASVEHDPFKLQGLLDSIDGYVSKPHIDEPTMEPYDPDKIDSVVDDLQGIVILVGKETRYVQPEVQKSLVDTKESIKQLKDIQEGPISSDERQQSQTEEPTEQPISSQDPPTSGTDSESEVQTQPDTSRPITTTDSWYYLEQTSCNPWQNSLTYYFQFEYIDGSGGVPNLELISSGDGATGEFSTSSTDQNGLFSHTLTNIPVGQYDMYLPTPVDGTIYYQFNTSHVISAQVYTCDASTVDDGGTTSQTQDNPESTPSGQCGESVPAGAVTEKWGYYESFDGYYMIHWGWQFDSTGVKIDYHTDGPTEGDNVDFWDYTDSDGVLGDVWTVSNPGTYTYEITAIDSQNYCGAADKITVIVP